MEEAWKAEFACSTVSLMNLFQTSRAAAKQPVSQESSNRLELKSWNVFANLCYWSGFLPFAVIAWNLLQVWWLGSIWFSRKCWSSLYTCCIPIIEHHEPSLSNFSICITKLQRNTVLLLLWRPKRASIHQWLSFVHQVIPNNHSSFRRTVSHLDVVSGRFRISTLNRLTSRLKLN